MAKFYRAICSACPRLRASTCMHPCSRVTAAPRRSRRPSPQATVGTGITVMYMDEGLDTGDILSQHKIPIRRRETAGSLHDRLARLAPEAVESALILLCEGKAARRTQDSALATYAAKLTRQSGRVDWTAPSGVVERMIRAMTPWPGAHTLFNDRTGNPRMLKLFGAIRINRTSGDPGRVLETGCKGILVGAGQGSVLLRQVQLEGKKRMSAGNFLLGHPLEAGTLLG